MTKRDLNPWRDPKCITWTRFREYYENMARESSPENIQLIESDIRNLDLLGTEKLEHRQAREWLVNRLKVMRMLLEAGVEQALIPREETNPWAGFPGANDRNSGYDNSGRI